MNTKSNQKQDIQLLNPADITVKRGIFRSRRETLPTSDLSAKGTTDDSDNLGKMNFQKS